MPQTSPALHDGDGLGDGRTPAGDVEAAHPECGHLAEPDACVGEEQDDEPVGLILASVIEYQRSSRRGTTSGSKRTALGLTSRQSAASCPGAGTPSE